MTNAASKDIREMLISDGITEDIYLGKEPVFSGNTIITIYDTTGEAPSPKLIIDYPTIQIRVKAKTYLVAHAAIFQCMDLLNGRPPETVNTTRYTGITAQTAIFQIGVDDNDLPILGCNFKLITENNTSANRVSI